MRHLPGSVAPDPGSAASALCSRPGGRPWPSSSNLARRLPSLNRANPASPPIDRGGDSFGVTAARPHARGEPSARVVHPALLMLFVVSVAAASSLITLAGLVSLQVS